MAISKYQSIIHLNANELKLKNHTVAEWAKKEDPSPCCLQETQFISKNTNRLYVRWYKIFYSNGNEKR